MPAEMAALALYSPRSDAPRRITDGRDDSAVTDGCLSAPRLTLRWSAGEFAFPWPGEELLTAQCT